MRLYKKYCYESQNYSDCVELVETCAHENGCDYIIECLPGVYIGYLLMQESNLAPAADVAGVKGSNWELKSRVYKMLDDVDEEFYVECPLCHRTEYVPFELEEEKMLEYARKHYPYCHCGAKMDGKDGE